MQKLEFLNKLIIPVVLKMYTYRKLLIKCSSVLSLTTLNIEIYLIWRNTTQVFLWLQLNKLRKSSFKRPYLNNSFKFGD